MDKDAKTAVAKSKAAAGSGARDVAVQIERDINLGRIGPGAWLKQIDLEQAYGVSRLAVRQALERLAERQQVELFPNRGYRVREFDVQRFNNIIDIRAILEVSAGEMVIDQLDKDSIERMRGLAQRFADSVTSGSFIEQDEANRLFHREMLHACPNRDLIDLIFDLRDRIPLSIQRERYNTNMVQRSAQEHFQMIELLEQGKRAEFAALIRQHTLGSRLAVPE